MNVTVLYFASVREALQCERERVELPPEVNSVSALRRHLASRGGEWARLEGERVRAAVNQEMAAPHTPVTSDDEVAFFPPVTGG